MREGKGKARGVMVRGREGREREGVREGKGEERRGEGK